jgi:uncharacterized protein (TIGR00369 family)
MDADAPAFNVPAFNVYLGTELRRMDGGEAVVTLELAPHHLNNRGVVHGGVLASLLDSALGAAVISAIPEEWWCATISLSVQFLEGARRGLLEADARVIRRGGRVAFAEGQVRDETGRLVAAAQGSWHLWTHKPEEPSGEAYVFVRGTGERLRVGKIVAVGRNYAEHVREIGGGAAEPPVLFLKPATAIVPHGGAMRIPEGMGPVHHEVELVVAIGKGGRAIPEEQALGHVLGYAVGLDMTLREVQAEAKRKGEPWTLAKGFDTSAPVSEIVPQTEVGDGSGLEIALDVNGIRRQGATTSAMLHGVPALVSYASRHLTLARGDLLFTGTPAGVGPVVPGDVLEARIEKVGVLRVRVESEDEHA